MKHELLVSGLSDITFYFVSRSLQIILCPQEEKVGIVLFILHYKVCVVVMNYLSKYLGVDQLDDLLYKQISSTSKHVNSTWNTMSGDNSKWAIICRCEFKNVCHGL